MAYWNFGITAGLLLTLAACGGGGGGGDGTPVTTPLPQPVTPPPSPSTPGDNNLEAMRDALLDRYSNPTVYTTLSQIPTNGSLTYDGYLSGELANRSDTITDTLIGVITLDVEFRSNTVVVSGSAGNFLDSNDAPLTGQLTLSDGSLNRNGNPSSDATLLMSASGTLRDAQGRNLEVGTQLEGDFLATNHRAVGGEVLGSIRVNGVDQDFDGGFIAER